MESGPERRITAMAPVPAGVASATIVSFLKSCCIELISDFSALPAGFITADHCAKVQFQLHGFYRHGDTSGAGGLGFGAVYPVNKIVAIGFIELHEIFKEPGVIGKTDFQISRCGNFKIGIFFNAQLQHIAKPGFERLPDTRIDGQNKPAVAGGDKAKACEFTTVNSAADPEKLSVVSFYLPGGGFRYYNIEPAGFFSVFFETFDFRAELHHIALS